jgi:hypothetical protein
MLPIRPPLAARLLLLALAFLFFPVACGGPEDGSPGSGYAAASPAPAPDPISVVRSGLVCDQVVNGQCVGPRPSPYDFNSLCPGKGYCVAPTYGATICTQVNVGEWCAWFQRGESVNLEALGYYYDSGTTHFRVRSFALQQSSDTIVFCSGPHNDEACWFWGAQGDKSRRTSYSFDLTGYTIKSLQIF